MAVSQRSPIASEKEKAQNTQGAMSVCLSLFLYCPVDVCPLLSEVGHHCSVNDRFCLPAVPDPLQATVSSPAPPNTLAVQLPWIVRTASCPQGPFFTAGVLKDVQAQAALLRV